MNSVASGAYHSCAIREGGKIYCWGMRDAGRLGNGSTASGSARRSCTPAAPARPPNGSTDLADLIAYLESL